MPARRSSRRPARLGPLGGSRVVLDEERRRSGPSSRGCRQPPADDRPVRSRRSPSMAPKSAPRPQSGDVAVDVVGRDGPGREPAAGIQGSHGRCADPRALREVPVEDADQLEVRVAQPDQPVECARARRAGRRRPARRPTSRSRSADGRVRVRAGDDEMVDAEQHRPRMHAVGPARPVASRHAIRDAPRHRPGHEPRAGTTRRDRGHRARRRRGPALLHRRRGRPAHRPAARRPTWSRCSAWTDPDATVLRLTFPDGQVVEDEVRAGRGLRRRHPEAADPRPRHRRSVGRAALGFMGRTVRVDPVRPYRARSRRDGAVSMVTDASLDKLGHHLGVGRRRRPAVSDADQPGRRHRPRRGHLDRPPGRARRRDPAGHRRRSRAARSRRTTRTRATATSTRCGRSRSTAASPGPRART